MLKKKYDVAVVGAGPAGMMAAVRAAECGAKVILLEKNEIPGIKLLMTGKERCNITNSEVEPRKFLQNFGKNGKFLMNGLYHFGVKETIEFFHEHNVPTKVERGGRVFPVSNRGKDVQELFLNLIKKNRVDLKYNCTVKKILRDDNAISKIILKDLEVEADNFIIATGGLSYPKTGSTGDGYKWAENLGHTIVDTEPVLTPVLIEEKLVKDLEGLSLKNVKISIFQNNKKYDERFGEALFTGNGMSGPIILDISKSIGKLLSSGNVDLRIDFKPALDVEKLDKRLLRDFESNSKKFAKNIFPDLMPKSLIPVMFNLTGIDPDQKAHTITKIERASLRKYLKEFPLTVYKLLGFNKSIITAGGVSLKEIEPKTMRSKIVNNLFFAGEILDLDGPTGGYNLQVCWTTGYIAGENAAKEVM
jgi:predicted Rossmann fold flavoprotein